MRCLEVLGTAALLAILPCLASCERCGGPSREDQVSTLDETPPAGTVNGATVPPEPVLASLWIPNSVHTRKPIHQPYGKRILQDGTVWFHTDQRRKPRLPDHAQEYQSVDLAWWFDGHRLTPREVRQLTDAIRELRLMDLSTDPPPPKETLIGTSESVWTFSVDGRPPHDVRVFHGQARPGEERFKRLFRRAVNNAMYRWLSDRGVDVGSIDPLPEP